MVYEKQESADFTFRQSKGMTESASNLANLNFWQALDVSNVGRKKAKQIESKPFLPVEHFRNLHFRNE